MFDIAFSELIVIGVVALLVIGPDKLPKVARTAGHLFGRAQRYVSEVKSDIDNQLRLEEMQKLQEEILQNTQHNESIKYEAGKIIKYDMGQTAPKYQAGQIVKHDVAQDDNLAAAPLNTPIITDKLQPASVQDKQGA